MRSMRPASAERLLQPVYSTTRCQAPSHHYCASFHTSTPLRAKRKPAHRSLSKTDLDRIAAARAETFKSYTDKEKAALKKIYTPKQLQAIEAAEAAITPEDLASGTRVRDDFLTPLYIDDYSRIQPVVDRDPKTVAAQNRDPEELMVRDALGQQPMGEEAQWQKVSRAFLHPQFEDEESYKLADQFNDVPRADLPDTPLGQLWNNADLMKSQIAPSATQKAIKAELDSIEAGGQQSIALADIAKQLESDLPTELTLDDAYTRPSEKDPRLYPAQQDGVSKYARRTQMSQLEERLLAQLGFPDAPFESRELPKIEEEGVRWETSTGEEEAKAAGGDDESAAAFARLALATGQSVEQLRRYRTKILVVHRVVNQTRLGKIASMYYLAVAGDEKGMLGIGEGKAAEADEASRVARLNAIRNMVPIRRYENRTIFGEVTGKSGAVELTISSRPPGFGLRVSSHVYEIAKCAGLSDLSAKVHRSRNPMNVAKAVWQALKSQKDPEDIARARGKKMVDVRKVYYAGLV